MVEASFGTFEPFNKHVRALLKEKAEERSETKAALARKKQWRKSVRLVQAGSMMRSSSAAPVPSSAPLEDAADEAI